MATFVESFMATYVEVFMATFVESFMATYVEVFMATFVESFMATYVYLFMATFLHNGGLNLQHGLQSQCCQREGPNDNSKATRGNVSFRFVWKRETNDTPLHGPPIYGVCEQQGHRPACAVWSAPLLFANPVDSIMIPLATRKIPIFWLVSVARGAFCNIFDLH